MAQEVEVKVKVDTGSATAGMDNLEKSFKKVDTAVKSTQEKTTDYGKQILQNGQLTQKLSQATGGMSDVFINAAKSIDLSNLSLKAMKGAIMSTGIGILVIALGELITMLSEMYSAEKKSEKASDDLTSAMERQADAFEKASEAAKFDNEMKMKYAKVNGETKDQMEKRNEDFYFSEKARIEKSIADNERLLESIFKNEDLSDEARKEANEKALAQAERLTKELSANNRKRRIDVADNLIAEREAKEEASKKAIEKEKQDGEKAKQLREQQKQALKNLEKKYEDDLENLKDKTEQQKLDRQKERAFEELALVKLSESEKEKARQLIIKDFQAKQIELDKSHQEKILALNNKLELDKQTLLAKSDEAKLLLQQENARKQLEVDLASMTATETEKNNARILLQNTFDEQNKLLALDKAKKANEEKVALINLELENDAVAFAAKKQLILDREAILLQDQSLTESQRLQIMKDSKDAQKKIADEEVAQVKAKEEAKKILLQAGFNALQSLTSVMLGEGKKAQQIQKGLTLVQIGIDTASAFSKLMAGSEAAAVATGPAYPFSKPIFYASGLAQILANVAKAKSALSGSTSGGNSGGGNASIAAPQMATPSFNVVGASATNQIAQTIAQKNQEPIKAYVVGNDVTTQQSLDRNIIKSASI